MHYTQQNITTIKSQNIHSHETNLHAKSLYQIVELDKIISGHIMYFHLMYLVYLRSNCIFTADICTILTVNPCDAQTTSCQSTNNQITCACKTGFQKNIYDPFSCVGK